MTYPHSCPNRLKPIIAAAIAREQIKRPKDSSTARRIKAKMFAIAEIVCSAAERGEWKPHLALSGIETFLDQIVGTDPYVSETATVSFQEYQELVAIITREITSSKGWLGYLNRLAALAENEPIASSTTPLQPTKPVAGNDTEDARRSERAAIRDAYFSRFAEKLMILDVCWAAHQRYREWTRWINGELKRGSKADRAFLAVLSGDKSPTEYRPQPRPKGWK